MNSNPKILLVGNYAPERIYSMINFAKLLQEQLSAQGGNVRLVTPPDVLGRIFQAPGPWQKWIWYIDKFLFYPIVLRFQSRWADVVHICDQGNALYSGCIANKPVLITCHDLLAIQAALGEDTPCPPSWTGKILQAGILAGLKRASMIACVSDTTRQIVRRIVGEQIPSTTIFNALENRYCVVQPSLVESRLQELSQKLRGQNYVLNVSGNNDYRKNRRGAIEAFAKFSLSWNGYLAFTGAPLADDLLTLCSELGISDRIVPLSHVSQEQLVTLYNGAFALLFPSHGEGFGLPVIEAHACGCPVICSNRPSLPEVAGSAALMADSDDYASLSNCLATLTEPEIRMSLIDRGFTNARRFSSENMVASYRDLYLGLLGQQS